ncbi:MAG: bifunctional folylpolyglutamate synthase/dihydrofolate synthase [Clostridia bacterium]|nr:bifunctional folylpolyglutamate synthase/dihydrofolate synthase [Clostridia bacterium]
MTYEEVKERILSRQKLGIKAGLERIVKLLSLLNNPQNELKFIHVAGTNGKGSVCYMLSSILTKSHYRTGLFISPAVVSFRERMQIDGKMIAKDELISLYEEIKPYVDLLDLQGEPLTVFELLCAMAFLWFRQKKCHVVVLETGLGGRLDATNVIARPLASVITSVSFDHMDILGNTIAQIAFEKAGIIKENGVTVLYPQENAAASEIIKKVALEKNNLLVNAEDLLDKLKVLPSDLFTTKFSLFDEVYNLNLSGRFQAKNALVVLLVTKVLVGNSFKISKSTIQEAFLRIVIPARFEKLTSEPLIILDGAHNYDGILRLKENLSKYLAPQDTIAIVGMLKDKEYKKEICEILSCFKKIIMTPIDNPRSLQIDDIDDIKDLSMTISGKITPAESSTAAINLAKKYMDVYFNKYKKSPVLVVCGSLYLASEVRPQILKIFKASKK